jgi:hypothetical protein
MLTVIKAAGRPMQKSSVFEQTYQHYLAQISSIDYLARADLLGAERDGEALIIPLYDRFYSVSGTAIEGRDGTTATDAVRVILGKYVLSCPDELPAPSQSWVTYREFADAAPLVSYFTSNTNKNIEIHFSGRVDLFEQRCSQLGASLEENTTYDVSARFLALPRIPVVVNFNDADEMFPAVCSILYRKSAHQFLDMECLAMTGTLLAGKLLAA